MFYVLGVALCLAVLFLVLVAGSLVLTPAIFLVKRKAGGAAPDVLANLLFFVRILPMGLACAVTVGLALPAFLEFEPHSTTEGMGLQLYGLALAGALVLTAVVLRGWRILCDAARAQRCWRENSVRLFVKGIDVPVFQVRGSSPLLAVAGIFQPQVFVSRNIAERLSPDELRAALAHEIAHASSFDNLKQLLLRTTRAPRWLAALHAADAGWSNAAEIAADHEALACGASVLDLSSALIKVGRMNRTSAGEPALASHLVSPSCGSSLEQRVSRLSALLQGAQRPVRSAGGRGFILALVFLAGGYLFCLQALLPSVHKALEFLVR